MIGSRPYYPFRRGPPPDAGRRLPGFDRRVGQPRAASMKRAGVRRPVPSNYQETKSVALLVARLLADVIGQAVEIAIELVGLAPAESAVALECALLRLDGVELTLQPARLAIGDPAVVHAALYALRDARFAFVDRRGTVVPLIVLHGDHHGRIGMAIDARVSGAGRDSRRSEHACNGECDQSLHVFVSFTDELRHICPARFPKRAAEVPS